MEKRLLGIVTLIIFLIYLGNCNTVLVVDKIVKAAIYNSYKPENSNYTDGNMIKEKSDTINEISIMKITKSPDINTLVLGKYKKKEMFDTSNRIISYATTTESSTNIKYYYNKYNVIQGTPYVQSPGVFKANGYGDDSLYGNYWWDGWAFSAEKGYYPTGTMHQGGWSAGILANKNYVGNGSNSPRVIVIGAYNHSSIDREDGYSIWWYDTMTYTATLTKYKGSLIQSNIIAEDGTYPVDGVHTDGYWYTRTSLVNTLPILTVISPTDNQKISQKVSIVPKCIVQDVDGNALTVKYYLDGETIARDSKNITDTATAQTIEFSELSLIGLKDGNHYIKLEVNDGIGSPVITIENFIIDNTNLIIENTSLSSTDKTILIESLLTNNNLELSGTPCRFSIGSNISDWINTPRYTFRFLIPNTLYTVKSEFQNVSGNIDVDERSIYTKAQIPVLLADNITSTTIDLRVLDQNPEYTQYQIVCDSKFVDSNGELTEIPTWITIPQKLMKVIGLSSNRGYVFKVKTKNIDNIETDFSDLMDFKAHIEAPYNLKAIASSTSILLTWDSILGSYEYDIEADGKIKGTTKTSFEHTGLDPSTQHTYRVRAKSIYGVSEWSPVIIVMTENNPPGTMGNINSYVSNKAVILTWDEVQDAQNYEVEIDGIAVDNGPETFCAESELLPNSQHSYRIKAINSAGDGEWSALSTITTKLLDTPVNIKVVEDENEIDLTWDAVETAEGYEIEINGQAAEIVTTNTYKHTSLPVETGYTYRIKAKNSQGESAWSDQVSAMTLPQRPKVPENISGHSIQKLITIKWDPVEGAIGYDVELDGVMIDNGNSTIYTHEDLSKSTYHTYRVRAKNDAVEGLWSRLLRIKTMAGLPVAPQNITVDSTITITTLSWEAQADALGYDIEIDGKVIENLTQTSYRHRRITPGTEHVYRIRTKNISGISPWSGYIINNALRAACKKGKDVDLGLTASDIIDFSKYTLTVTYNKDVLDVTDLCTFSPKIELAKGNIVGTGITITEYIPGKIVFVVDKSVPPGESWTGVINSIKFMAKVSGGTNITYSVFSKPEE